MKKWENKKLSFEERSKYFVRDMSKKDKIDEIAKIVSSIPVLDTYSNLPNSIYHEIIKEIYSVFPQISFICAMFGNDLACNAANHFIKHAIKKKKIDEKMLNELVNKIICHRIKFTDMSADEQNYSQLDDKRIIFENSERLVTESIVLLKNNNLLPLSKEKTESIAVIGPNVNNTDVLTALNVSSDENTILHGFLEAYPNVRISYAKGCDYSEKLDDNDIYEAVKVAEQATVIILALGLTPELEKKLSKNTKKHVLPKAQIELMENLHKLGKPIVLLNFSGAGVDLERASEICDAILQCWYPYKKTDDAIAKVLFGDCTISGKLPFTFYKNSSFKETKSKTKECKKENILYPFGYGLNYSNVEYYRIYLSSASIKAGEDIVVTIYVKNKGSYDTKDNIQVYMLDEQTSVEVPDIKLVASKLVELPRDKEIRISLRIKAEHMATVKEDGSKKIEPGRFSLYVGSGQPDDLTADLYNRDCLHIGFLVE